MPSNRFPKAISASEWMRCNIIDSKTLIISFDESKFKVTSSGSTISNGQVFSFTGDSEVLVESLIGTVDITYNGAWKDDSRSSSSAAGDELGTQTIIYITNCAYFGKMTGYMEIYC